MAFKLSTKCRYGTRAIVEIAKGYGKVPVKRKDIAKSQRISESYLENILISLKNNGMIDTIRGAQGGYMLKKPPSAIVLFDVVQALEGSLAPVECLERQSACNRIPHCSTRNLWKNLMDAQKKVLQSVTLQNLIDGEKTEEVNFCI
ncbi:MAG TPA: Rrf2 family transcriptional regulator [Chitinivibrionales bacterium]|nr:Rrf2 family transcriptional regulator [Chitinivibrionales bacterium]